MYRLIRELLFALPPEISHHVALVGLSVLERYGLSERLFGAVPGSEVELLGLKFRNPVGLAAGFDKDGVAIAGLAAAGFGFVEVGTVTPLPQPGSARPRLFRLRREQALINRMGFNNLGVSHLVRQIEAVRSRLPDACPLGVNIGMNRVTPRDRALDDYCLCASEVAAVADYITLNLSSPNTPGVRDLQRIEALMPLLASVREHLERAPRCPPLVVKISPDLAEPDLAALAGVLKRCGADAVIATNTTLSRPADLRSRHRAEQGGLSGKPLLDEALRTLVTLATHLDGLPLIACGGIQDRDTAQQVLRAGASLMQVYTGFIYQGPRLIRQLCEACEQEASRLLAPSNVH